MKLLDLIRLASTANRSTPSLRQRIRALHVNRRMHERRPFSTIIQKA